MSSKELRYAAAVVVGVMFDVVFFWKFQPYSAREHGHDLLPWYFLPVLAFVTGLLLSVGIEGKKRPSSVDSPRRTHASSSRIAPPIRQITIFGHSSSS